MNNSDFGDYEQMCQILTSSQNVQERTKAESMLITFLTSIENLPKLQMIVNNIDSDTVIFVTCELLSKIVQQTRFEININVPSNREDMIENQVNPNATTVDHFLQFYEIFIKVLLVKYEKMKNFAINSIANLLGSILKRVWLDVKDNQTILEKTKSYFFVQNNHALENIGLRLFEQIILNISYYDPKDSYLNHRKVMISFQKASLTFILETVLELLYEDLPQIKAQTIDQTVGIQNLIQSFKVVFLCVYYNFSFSFLDLDLDYDASEVTFVNFPEGWSKIISSTEVYELFYLSYLMLSTFSEENSLLVLRCLNRFISCRLTIFENKEQIKTFRRGIFKALFNFSKTIYQKVTEPILLEIVEGNVRFLTNIGSRKARKQPNFEEWLEIIKDMTIIGLQNGCQVTNALPSKLFELWKKLLKQIFNDEQMKVFSPKIEAYAFEVTSRFMDSILSNSDGFFANFNYDSSKKFKKQMVLYFASLYDIFNIKLNENLKNVNNLLNGLFLKYNEMITNNTHMQTDSFFNIDQLSVMFAIIINTHLTQNNNEKTVIYDVPTIEESAYEGANLALCFKIIQITLNLQQNGKWISNRTFELLTLMFIENYTTLTIDGLFAYKDTDGISQSSARIHLVTSRSLGTEDYSQTIELFMTKLSNNLQYSDPYLLSYSLYILKITIIKLKSYVKREVFQQLNALRILLKTLEEFNKTALFEKKHYNLRKKAYEIIAIAWLDDYFDNFLETVDKISSIIYQTNFPNNNITNDNLIRFFKDSNGILGYLDVPKIFKYYFKTTFPLYVTIIENQIPLFINDLEVLNAFLDFYFALIQNRSSRLSSDPNSQIGYQVFITFCKFLENAGEKIKLMIIELKQNQEYEYHYPKIKVIGKVLKIFNTFIKGRYINFSVFQIFESDKFINYLRFNLDVGTACFDIFQIFPKFFEIHLDNLFSLSESCLEIIFTYLEPEYPLRILKQSFETIRLVQEDKFGSLELKIFQDDVLLSKIRTLIYHTCCFIFEEYNLKPLPKMKENIENCLAMASDMTKNYMKTILEAIFFSNKSVHVKSILSSILYSLIITNEKAFQEILSSFLLNLSTNEEQYANYQNIFAEVFQGKTICEFPIRKIGIDRKFDSLNFDKFTKNLKNATTAITSILLEGKPRSLGFFAIQNT